MVKGKRTLTKKQALANYTSNLSKVVSDFCDAVSQLEPEQGVGINELEDYFQKDLNKVIDILYQQVPPPKSDKGDKRLKQDISGINAKYIDQIKFEYEKHGLNDELTMNFILNLLDPFGHITERLDQLDIIIDWAIAHRDDIIAEQKERMAKEEAARSNTKTVINPINTASEQVNIINKTQEDTMSNETKNTNKTPNRFSKLATDLWKSFKCTCSNIADNFKRLWGMVKDDVIAIKDAPKDIVHLDRENISDSLKDLGKSLLLKLEVVVRSTFDLVFNTVTATSELLSRVIHGSYRVLQLTLDLAMAPITLIVQGCRQIARSLANSKMVEEPVAS